MSDPTDDELIQRSQQGDLQAFDGLVLRHQARLFNFLYRLLNHYEEAKELTQETLVRAFRGIKGFRGEAMFSTWLYTIATNLARNRIRQLQRTRNVIAGSLDDPVSPEPGAPAHDAPDPQPSAAGLIEAEERERLVWAAVHRLEEPYRTAVILRDLQGLAYEEIATICACALGTVKSRLARAREQLKRLLEGIL
ncbi:MAG: sigma-70 family RNA polymerase sigma factor [Candidatus Omnitrophica bacterium]|nr:sigma-70 family RNA polymerase sigma factor [Candidatus Omnitrophota bacterium]